MNVVLNKKNKYLSYKLNKIDGYMFKPKRKINNLVIVDKKYINIILTKKILKDINKTIKTIKLMLNSDVTIVDDCDMMLKEIKRIIFNIENKYKKYFDEFDYFELIKELYVMNMELNLKKKLIDNNI